MICALAVAACAILWNRYQAADARADKAEAALEVEKRNEKIVTQYVTKIVEVERTRPVVGAALERLCASAGLSGAGQPDEAGTANTHDGPTLEGLADDIVACRANSGQLTSLHEVLRPQVK